MRVSGRHVVYALAVLSAALFVADLQYEGVLTMPGKVSLADERKVAALVAGYEGIPLALDSRTQSSSCRLAGALPDHACTPGAVFHNIDTQEICKEGYSAKARSVSATLKKRVYREYGLSYPQPTGTYEVDHLIPLELGGSNDIANLFPEAADPTPGFREKDLVENYLHDEACGGTIGLPAAQRQIADDWLSVYRSLSPDTIAALQAQYKSWSQGGK